VIPGRFVFDQPTQQIQALLPQCPIVKRNAGGDHRLGQNRIRVRESRLRPWPGGVAVRFGHCVGVIDEKCERGPMRGVEGDEFGGGTLHPMSGYGILRVARMRTPTDTGVGTAPSPVRRRLAWSAR